MMRCPGNTRLALTERFRCHCWDVSSSVARPSPGSRRSCGNSFHEALGRRAAINVELMAREPIYIVGPVRRPGSYAYAPGLTTLHAVALAGGLDEAQGALQGSVEAVRESGNIRRATERLEQLLARLAVLEADRDGRGPVAPERLRALVGSAAATSMISEEQARRAPELEIRGEREKSLSMAVDVASRLLGLARERVPPTETAVAMRAERVAALKGLQQRGVFERVVVLQAQSELSDTQNRLVEEKSNVLHAELALQAAREEHLRFVAERKDRLVTEISNISEQIGDMELGIATSVGVLRSLATSATPAGLQESDAQLSFEIVRQTPAGPRVLEASMTTSLDPGDLVRVMLGGPTASVGRWAEEPEPRSGWDQTARRAIGSR